MSFGLGYGLASSYVPVGPAHLFLGRIRRLAWS